jgi:transposase
VEFFRQFRPFQVVVEATASYQWFVELVEPLAEKIVLANPKKLRVIAESTKKTDRLDAHVLAEFLARDMIPKAHMPTPRQRQHRALVRHRQYIRGRMTAVRNKLRRVSATITLTAATCLPSTTPTSTPSSFRSAMPIASSSTSCGPITSTSPNNS